MNPKIFKSALVANKEQLCSMINGNLFLYRLHCYGVIDEDTYGKLIGLLNSSEKFDKLLEFLTPDEVCWLTILHILRDLGNVEIANTLENTLNGIHIAYQNPSLGDLNILGTVVSILSEDSYLVTNWMKFDHKLKVANPDSVQLENGFKNLTITSYELFTRLLTNWISKKSRDANLKNLIAALKGQFNNTADTLTEVFLTTEKVKTEVTRGIETMEVEETEEFTQSAWETKWSNPFASLSLTFLITVPDGFVFKNENAHTKIQTTVKFLFPKGSVESNLERTKEIDEIIRGSKSINRKNVSSVNIVKCLQYFTRNFSLNDIDTLFGSDDQTIDTLFENNEEAIDDLAVLKSRAKRLNDIEGICIEMELYGPSLRSWLNEACNTDNYEPTDEFKLKIANGIIGGLKFLHKHRILHRDIRPENIFFSVSSTEKYQLPVKIGEFGLSRTVEDDFSRTMSVDNGCRLYKAPEVDMRERYGKQADLYSMGLVLWEIFEPTPFKNLQRRFDRLVRDREVVVVQENANVPNLKPTIISLTQKDKSLRTASIEEVCLN